QRHYSIALLGQAQLAEVIDIPGPQVPGIGDPLGNESHRVFPDDVGNSNATDLATFPAANPWSTASVSRSAIDRILREWE
ncbi:MAG TPA: hypothetical protein VI232_11555, partial [Reyranella sp.]